MEGDVQDAPQGYVSIDKYNDLKSKYDALKEDFDEYRIDAEDWAKRAADKIRKSKETVRQWQIYIDKTNAKLALRQARQEALHQAEQDLATPRAKHDNDETLANQPPIPHPAVEAARDVSMVSAHSPAHSKITSSQTTEGEAASSSSHADRSDDSPVVVSARALRRRHHSPIMTSQQIRIKHEDLSSSPIMQPVFIPPFLRTETSDLDVVRRRLDMGQTRPERNVEQVQESMETPLISRASNSGSFVGNAAVSPPRLNDSFIRDHIRDSNETSHAIKPESGLQHEPRIDETEPQTARKSADPRPEGGPLRDLSPNTPTLPRSNASSFTSKRKLDNTHGAAQIHILSEDGDDVSLGSKRRRISPNQQQPTPKSAGPSRRNQLLTGSSPQIDRTVLSPRTAVKVRPSRASPVSRPQSERPVRSIQKAPETPLDRQPPNTRPTTTTSDNFDPDQDPLPITPSQEPLRSRPLHRLNLDSFKINPKYSSNLGYAYRETVRKRDERACLPGCTREECCGAIRRFIAAGGLPADTSLTDDELTLQGYLGSAYAQTIHKASEEEKREMLVEARAKAFADSHGKHRQAFERRTTPPGFWRTDMPTTQELEGYKEEAREQERQKVEGRWRDAMRGGGRWMFRDE